jgi:hypothetical protein
VERVADADSRAIKAGGLYRPLVIVIDPNDDFQYTA